MENVLSEVSIEVVVLGVEKWLHIAFHGDEVIHVDLITCDAIDVNVDDVHGGVKLTGFWDEDVFVAESIQLLH